MQCFRFIVYLSAVCPTLSYRNPQQKNAYIYVEDGFYKDGFYKGRNRNGTIEVSKQNGDNPICYQRGVLKSEDVMFNLGTYAEIMHFVDKLKKYPEFRINQKKSPLEQIVNIMAGLEARHGFYEEVNLGIVKLQADVTPRSLPTNENVKSGQEEIYLKLRDAICHIFDLYPMNPRLFCAEVVQAIHSTFIALCEAHMIGLNIMSTKPDYPQPPQMRDAYYSVNCWKAYRKYFAGPYKKILRGRLILLATLRPNPDFLIDWGSFLNFWVTANMVEVIQRGVALLESDIKKNPSRRHLDPANEQFLGVFTTKIDEMMHQMEDCLRCSFYLSKNREEIRDFFIKGGLILKIDHQFSVPETLEIQNTLAQFEEYFKIGIGMIAKPSDSPNRRHQTLVQNMLDYAQNVMPSDPVICVTDVVIYLDEVHLKRKDPLCKRPGCCAIQ